jgi:hypothetical protein
MKTILTENTLIPISAIVLVFGASAWLTTVWKQGEANASEIKDIKQTQTNDMEKIDYKLEKINEKIDRLLEKQKLR